MQIFFAFLLFLLSLCLILFYFCPRIFFFHFLFLVLFILFPLLLLFPLTPTHLSFLSPPLTLLFPSSTSFFYSSSSSSSFSFIFPLPYFCSFFFHLSHSLHIFTIFMSIIISLYIKLTWFSFPFFPLRPSPFVLCPSPHFTQTQPLPFAPTLHPHPI